MSNTEKYNAKKIYKDIFFAFVATLSISIMWFIASFVYLVFANDDGYTTFLDLFLAISVLTFITSSVILFFGILIFLLIKDRIISIK